MARKVKCQVTQEYGMSDEFIKIDNKYYKSQQVYDQYKKNTEDYKLLINLICNDFLNYQKGQVFPTMLTKKIKELEFYPNEVIIKTVEKNYETLKYWMDNKEFSNDTGKISYLFAIIKGNINDIYKEWKRNNLTEQYEKKSIIDTEENIETLNTTQKGKDISNWLEDDEL